MFNNLTAALKELASAYVGADSITSKGVVY